MWVSHAEECEPKSCWRKKKKSERQGIDELVEEQRKTKEIPDHALADPLMLASVPFYFLYSLSTFIPSCISTACQTCYCTHYGNQDFSWDSEH